MRQKGLGVTPPGHYISVDIKAFIKLLLYLIHSVLYLVPQDDLLSNYNSSRCPAAQILEKQIWEAQLK